MNIAIRLLVLTFSASLLGGCAATQLLDANGENMFDRDGVYTLTNLHFTKRRKGDPSTSTINYIGGYLVPRCSEVRLTDINEKNLVVMRNGQRHNFQLGRNTPEPFEDVIRKYFGTRCDNSAVTSLSKVDQQGIAAGEPRVGMTKKGIIYAIGYPPSHATASLEQDEWVYWVSRFNRQIVYFNNGRVVRIKD